MHSCTDPYLLFFYAEQCPSSSSMVSVLRKVQERFGERLPCISLDINSLLAKHRHGNISQAPTLVLMRNGQELWRSTGLMHTTEVLEAIQSVL